MIKYQNLSRKERWLLNYLNGFGLHDRSLGKDSSTRKYAELACMDKFKLAVDICRYFDINTVNPQDLKNYGQIKKSQTFKFFEAT